MANGLDGSNDGTPTPLALTLLDSVDEDEEL
jgi:hypothetical protein